MNNLMEEMCRARCEEWSSPFQKALASNGPQPEALCGALWISTAVSIQRCSPFHRWLVSRLQVLSNSHFINITRVMFIPQKT